MRSVFLLVGAAACVEAGTIQGVVVEHASGRPLIRTVVRLAPVPRPGVRAGQALTTRAGRSGHFVFPAVVPGLYLLSAERDGYFPAAFGQRLPMGRGTPLEVADDSDIFAELRMRHQGAITGRVLDENGVGAAGVSVVAYSAKLPMRSAGTATSDDRGVYRIHGLAPGQYWVRSAAHTLDDGSGWLPTFGPLAREARDATIHKVSVDADTTDADVSPEPGALFHLGGVVACDTDSPVPVVVTLSSETGRRMARTSCPKGEYRFDGLAPAAYEVFATLEDFTASGFIELFLAHDSDAGNVQVTRSPTADILVSRAGTGGAADIPIRLIGRRQDLSETESAHEIKGPRVTLTPGYWEFRAYAPTGQYVDAITALRSARRRPWKAERASDWFEVFIEPFNPTRIAISVSDKAGEIAGRVLADGRPVAGAPVFLWPTAESARRSLGGPLQGLSDTEGRYRFNSLPPGDYRILASFDMYEIDEELLGLSRAPIVRAESSQAVNIDLTVWVAPW